MDEFLLQFLYQFFAHVVDVQAHDARVLDESLVVACVEGSASQHIVKLLGLISLAPFLFFFRNATERIRSILEEGRVCNVLPQVVDTTRLWLTTLEIGWR